MINRKLAVLIITYLMISSCDSANGFSVESNIETHRSSNVDTNLCLSPISISAVAPLSIRQYSFSQDKSALIPNGMVYPSRSGSNIVYNRILGYNRMHEASIGTYDTVTRRYQSNGRNANSQRMHIRLPSGEVSDRTYICGIDISILTSKTVPYYTRYTIQEPSSHTIYFRSSNGAINDRVSLMAFQSYGDRVDSVSFGSGVTVIDKSFSEQSDIVKRLNFKNPQECCITRYPGWGISFSMSNGDVTDYRDSDGWREVDQVNVVVHYAN